MKFNCQKCECDLDHLEHSGWDGYCNDPESCSWQQVKYRGLNCIERRTFYTFEDAVNKQFLIEYNNDFEKILNEV